MAKKKTTPLTPEQRKDAFFQAIPLSEVNGRTFYFGRQKPKDIQYLTKKEFKALRRENPRPHEPYDIELNPNYGKPGALAYRMWAGIEKLISDGGPDFNGRLQLSTRSLARICERSYGGKTAVEIEEAFDQLDSLKIHEWVPVEVRRDGSDEITISHSPNSFSLFSRVMDVIDDKTNVTAFYIFQVNDYVLRLIQQDHYYFCMSSRRITGLPPQAHSVARILYRYLSYRYSSEKTKKFEYTKDYATMCRTWFGDIKPLSTISQIKQKHIAPRLDPLKEIKLVSSYAVVKNKAKDGFNVVIKPGKGFFEDYDLFYNSSNQLSLPLDTFLPDEPINLDDEGDLPKEIFFKEENDSPESLAMALLGHFARQWHNQDTGHKFTRSEVAYAHELLADHDLFEAKAFVDFGIAQARTTNFQMATFNGIKNYYAQWSADHKKSAAEMQRIEAETERDIDSHMKMKYESWLTSELELIISALSENDLADLRTQAREELAQEHPEQNGFMDGWVMARVRDNICAQRNIPSYDLWRKQQGF